MPKLGDKVKDRITGFTGIVIARTDWLYGCVRYQVQSSALHEGKPIDPHGFDEDQLDVIDALDGIKDDAGAKTTGGDRDFKPTRW